MDINPATPGHALVIPRAHSKDLMEISDEDLAACTIAARRLAKTMADTLDPEGFNVLNCCGAAAWQSVFHFHLHVIPRYEDDSLEVPTRSQEADADELAGVADELRG